ncbi:MAG: hypothetical protein NT165_01300 [Candidatus Falkowbacteria bacterium]|nr:hypothetical protein [Candidatus Falkowbacteria bacterium]
MSGESAKISDEPLSTAHPVVLLLLDGWGVAPESEGNAINKKNSKNFSKLLSEYPAGILESKPFPESDRYSLLGAHHQLTSFLSESKISQMYLMESEKAPAVAACFVGEDNLGQIECKIISSPVCDAYNLKPEMSIDELGRLSIKAIREERFGFILISVANLEAVAATGDLEATKKTVARVDSLLGKITEEVLLKKGTIIISSTSGNVEKMIDVRTDLTDKESTDNPLPFLIVGEEFKGRSLFENDAPGGDLSLLEPVGGLEDIPATIIGLLKLDKPVSMEGEDLLKK